MNYYPTAFGLFCASVALVLSGCANTVDLRATNPAREFVSAKEPQKLAGCIADKLESRYRTTINTRPTAKGFTIWKEEDLGLFGKSTSLVVDVSGTSPEVKVSVFFASDILASAKDAVTLSVIDCNS